MYPPTNFCEWGRSIVGPLSSGMSQCATAPCRVRAADMRCMCAGIRRQLVLVDEAEVVVAVRNLRCATGIDDVDL